MISGTLFITITHLASGEFCFYQNEHFNPSVLGPARGSHRKRDEMRLTPDQFEPGGDMCLLVAGSRSHPLFVHERTVPFCSKSVQ